MDKKEEERRAIRELRASEFGEAVLAVSLWALFLWWLFS